MGLDSQDLGLGSMAWEGTREGPGDRGISGDLRAALGVLRLLPREALHRAPTPPPTAEQRDDVGAMLRARLAQLETLPDRAAPSNSLEA